MKSKRPETLTLADPYLIELLIDYGKERGLNLIEAATDAILASVDPTYLPERKKATVAPRRAPRGLDVA